jgi:AraC family transcriptional regulator, arabinose operon regulatory protein
MEHEQLFPPQPFEVRLNTRPTYWHCERGWEWKSRPLLDHLLWYVMDGVGAMRLDSHLWELRAGSSFVFAPGACPHGTQDPDRRLVVFGMHFDLINAYGQRLPQTRGLLPPPGHVVRDTTFFATLAQRCDASFRRGDALGERQSHLFLQAMVLHLWEEALYPAPSAVDLALDEIMRAIQLEPGKRWTVDELAQRAHLSRAQFVRRFRAIAGLAPARFMIQARLERARQLIQETNMTLVQIADALGYEDVSFFSRQYKRYTGSAPSTLRR